MNMYELLIKQKEGYDFVCRFREGNIGVAILNGKLFHINMKNGKPIYKEKYDRITHFANNTAKVLLGKDEFIIDTSGKRVPFECIYYIGSRKDTLFIIDYNGDKIFKTGCFSGTLKEFKNAVKMTHKRNSKYYKEYMKVIKECKGEKTCLKERSLMLLKSIFRKKKSNTKRG